ncbi:MBL fold metallo-hydrolase [Streptomyces sp. NPDC004675]|uniref:pyrroloquinoline quinone biosynthesis protein PqqB n=1 Tax=Streptomyces sp. NPDC004675 TaxID=3154286 RepID=UPI0033B61FC3
MVVRVVLLGTATGGGFPQWNCACPLCHAARDGELPSRSQECVAVSGNSRDWWLLHASPDIRTQLTAAAPLRPGPGPRDTPVRGVLLTDAEADHVTGLGVLRGAAELKVYAAPPVLHALAPLRAALDRYAVWQWADALTEGGFVLSGGLVVTAHPVGDRAPGYPRDARGSAPWVIAYRIEDLATGGVLVYAPRVGARSQPLDELLPTADCALLDGTFYAAEEMGTAVPDEYGPAATGQPAGTGEHGSLVALVRRPGRIHSPRGGTDPLPVRVSAPRRPVIETGAEVLPDGAEFSV